MWKSAHWIKNGRKRFDDLNQTRDRFLGSNAYGWVMVLRLYFESRLMGRVWGTNGKTNTKLEELLIWGGRLWKFEHRSNNILAKMGQSWTSKDQKLTVWDCFIFALSFVCFIIQKLSKNNSITKSIFVLILGIITWH